MGVPPDQTLLKITGISTISGVMPLFSSYNCEQTIEPIPAATNTERDLNGNLIDLTRPELRKYTTTIQCNDVMFAPGLDSTWPGMTVVIDCIVFMVTPVSWTPERPVVPGSSYTTPDGQFTAYNPQLTCLIDSFNIKFDEWGAKVGWTLKASEV